MRVGIRSYGSYREHLESVGSIDLRNNIQYAHFLRSEGHEVCFFDENAREVVGFDVVLDAPRERCGHIRAAHHIHSFFFPFDRYSLEIPCALSNPCYHSGQFILSSPYKHGYTKAKDQLADFNYKHLLFLPLPYPDDLCPVDLVPGFQRDVIFWANKGNFSSDYGPEWNMHFITNGIETLKALVRLNRRANFKTVFLLDHLIRETRVDWRGEVLDLIHQLKDVERLEQVPWSQYVRLMARTKINTHVGGLTSGINECLFTRGVPAAPEKFVFFQDVAAELKILPPAETATADEIYDAYERLWFDEKYYSYVHDAFQDVFVDHRSAGLRKHWQQAIEELNGAV